MIDRISTPVVGFRLVILRRPRLKSAEEFSNFLGFTMPVSCSGSRQPLLTMTVHFVGLLGCYDTRARPELTFF